MKQVTINNIENVLKNGGYFVYGTTPSRNCYVYSRFHNGEFHTVIQRNEPYSSCVSSGKTLRETLCCAETYIDVSGDVVSPSRSTSRIANGDYLVYLDSVIFEWRNTLQNN